MFDQKKMIPRRPSVKFNIPKGTTIDYKNLNLLQKFISDRGKILSRRFTGVSAKEQRDLVMAIRRAKILALLSAIGQRR